MILTQIYAAFHSAPELDWLGVLPDVIQDSIESLRHRITHFRNGEMFERIAKGVRELQYLYRDGLPKISAMDEAIARGGPVTQQRQ